MNSREISLEGLDSAFRVAVDAVLEKKGEDVLVLDLHGLTSFTDYFLICTGNSNRQLKSIAEEVERQMKLHGERPKHIEGYPAGDWILMDYVDFVVHIFTPASRSYYELERLWGDAGRLAIAM